MSNGNSSHGYQDKTFLPVWNAWVKYDVKGGEALAEVLISEFLSACGNAQLFVPYKFFDSLESCISPNFLSADEVFVPFRKLVRASDGRLHKKDFKHNFSFILGVLNRVTGCNNLDFLHQMAYLDAMFGNTDRHMSNFGVIMNSNGNARVSPIFDNGLAFHLAEGAYWDFDNLVRGFGGVIQPYAVQAPTVLNSLYNLFNFDVQRFVQSHNQSITVDIRVFGAMLNILCNHFPFDSQGIDTRKYLESTYGSFRRSRYK